MIAMYNRYIPQSDGTFQRSRMEDNIPAQKTNTPLPCPPPPPVPEPCTPKPEPCPPSCPYMHRPVHTNPQRQHKKAYPQKNSVSSFFKQLLPKDFDTSDLMIVLLLLIMSGDCPEDQNTALLTLVLYLFL